MKKCVTCFLMGVIMAMSLPAIANTLTGKPIEGTFPVYLHGNKLSKDAVVIESTSYLPVRVLGEALNLDIRFNNGQVLLERKPTNDGWKALEYEIRSDKIIIKEQPNYMYQVGEEVYIATNIMDSIERDKLWEQGKLTIYNGRSFIKISDFGLTVVIRDGVMWLE